MNSIKSMLPVALFFLAMGCAGGKQSDKKEVPTEVDYLTVDKPPAGSNEKSGYAASDSISTYFDERNGNKKKINPFTSMAAKGFVGDSTRIFIKTADIKFRVKSTIQASYEIEDITHRFGGYVAYTHLESEVSSKSVIQVSEDSLLETVRYTVKNTITIRVPADKMDSCLRAISVLVDYMDYRTIKVHNVYFDLLAKQLAQERIRKFQGKVQHAVEKHGDHLDEITESQESMLYQQELADQAKLDALLLKDSVEYSTIQLSIYQRDAIKRELIFNEKYIDAYEPGFGYKLKQSFKTGWRGFTTLILFLTKFWVLFLMAGIGAVIIRLVTRK